MANILETVGPSDDSTVVEVHSKLADAPSTVATARVDAFDLDQEPTSIGEPAAISGDRTRSFDRTLDGAAPLVIDTVASGSGRRFGPFVLEERIGVGGQGAVWRAVQTEPFVRVVALKLLPVDAIFEPGLIEQFRKEAERGGKLSGPSILPVLDFGTVQGRCYLSMPLVQGFSLAEVLEQRRLHLKEKPPADLHRLAILAEPLYQREAVSVLTRITRALASAHEGRILHRDVKPSNILLDRAGGERVYLSDFGLARDLDHSTTVHEGFQPGTPIYMAPERLLGKPGCEDVPSDIFSMGATLYETLTLERPFTIPKGLPITAWPSHLARLQPARPRKLNPKIPRDLEAVILKSIDPNPTLRYPSATALADDLDRFLKGEPVLARPAGPLRTGGRWLARHRKVLNGIAALALIVATVGVIRLGIGVYAARARASARQALVREEFIEAGRFAGQAQALDPDHPETLALVRELARAMVIESQDSTDNTNVDQALQWFRAWSDLNNRQTGKTETGPRREFAKELGLLDLPVESDVPFTVMTLHAVRPDARPRDQPPLYTIWAGARTIPNVLPELVDGLYWVTARVQATGAFSEFLYQPPPGRASDFIPPLFVHPRLTAEASKGMTLVKGGRLTRKTGEVDDPQSPVTTVAVDDFYLDPTEVTQKDFVEFLQERGDEKTAKRIWPRSGKPEWNRLDWPVTNVSYAEATEYAAWTGCRLPSEDELEWAARGDSGRIVPEGIPKGSRPTGPEWFRLHGVREVKLDRTDGDPPIFGLYGNAAELTLFRYRPNLIDVSKSKPSVSDTNVYRRRPFIYAWGGFVVRSGLVPVAGLRAFRPLGYEDRAVITIDRTEPNIGFRRARSIVPRFRTQIPLL